MTLTIFSINGFGGNMWAGPQAEVAQYLSNQGLNLAYWQPIGYNSGAFPLSIGVNSGLAELKNQRAQHPGPYLISAWSEGAIISELYLQQDKSGDCKGGVMYGNPYRAAGQWNPIAPALGAVPDPGGAGIGGPRNNWRTPDSVHHYCHGPNQPSYDGKPGVDMYTCCPTNGVGVVIRIIFDFVLTQWTGEILDLWLFGEELITSGAHAALDVTQAIIMAISFYGGQTKPHVDYDSYAGKTYLANLARSL
jgi:hypothetical protein